jgi:spermidine/putrescine transport system substrate-binding protein
MANPYEIFWDPNYKGKIHIFNDYREVISLALLKNGITDLNTSNRNEIRRAVNDLLELAPLVSSLDVNGYKDLPRGRAWIHQAWSGDAIAAPYYFPKGHDPSVLRYWFPPDGGGAVANDAIGVLNNGRNPVLAHYFLNYILDNKVALKNFSWNGYQPPQRQLDPATLVARGYVAANVANAIVHRHDFNTSFMELELDPSVDTLWQSGYRKFAQSV